MKKFSLVVEIATEDNFEKGDCKKCPLKQIKKFKCISKGECPLEEIKE